MSSTYTYSIQAKELTITENNKATLFWKGKPKLLDVIFLIPIQDNDDCIVLLDPFQADVVQTKNLLRCGPDGSIQWESGLPLKTLHGIKRTNHEVYVFVKIENGLIVATSASGFLDYIGLETGDIINTIFVK